jgi:hypothetical protein
MCTIPGIIAISITVWAMILAEKQINIAKLIDAF